MNENSFGMKVPQTVAPVVVQFGVVVVQDPVVAMVLQIKGSVQVGSPATAKHAVAGPATGEVHIHPPTVPSHGPFCLVHSALQQPVHSGAKILVVVVDESVEVIGEDFDDEDVS
jgi:hypothetical protein